MRRQNNPKFLLVLNYSPIRSEKNTILEESVRCGLCHIQEVLGRGADKGGTRSNVRGEIQLRDIQDSK